MSDSKRLTQELVNKLKHLFGDRLISVCLYGSGAREENNITSTNALDVLVIMQNLTSQDLQTASTVSLWWEQKARTLPVFLSEAEWTNANDVFALEYADIKDWHWLAYGKDLFSTIEVDLQSLRLICELEVYRKLLFLRQRILLFQQKPDVLLSLMKEANHSFAAIFRSIFRFCQPEKSIANDNQSVFAQLAEVIPGFSKEPFLATSYNAKLDKSIILPLFEQYVAQISLVNHFLNEASVFVEVRRSEQ